MTVIHVENAAAAHLLAAAKLRQEHQQEEDERNSSKETKACSAREALPEATTTHLHDQQLSGTALSVGDFEQNVVSLYHEAAGVPPPRITLPYWTLWVLVRASATLSVFLYAAFRIQVINHIVYASVTTLLWVNSSHIHPRRSRFRRQK